MQGAEAQAQLSPPQVAALHDRMQQLTEMVHNQKKQKRQARFQARQEQAAAVRRHQQRADMKQADKDEAARKATEAQLYAMSQVSLVCQQRSLTLF